MRKILVDAVRKRYPGITVNNDFELLLLGTCLNEMSESEAREYIDRELVIALEMRDSVDAVIATARKVVDTRVDPTGVCMYVAHGVITC